MLCIAFTINKYAACREILRQQEIEVTHFAVLQYVCDRTRPGVTGKCYNYLNPLTLTVALSVRVPGCQKLQMTA